MNVTLSVGDGNWELAALAVSEVSWWVGEESISSAAWAANLGATELGVSSLPGSLKLWNSLLSEFLAVFHISLVDDLSGLLHLLEVWLELLHFLLEESISNSLNLKGSSLPGVDHLLNLSIIDGDGGGRSSGSKKGNGSESHL